MSAEKPKTLFYKRATFIAHLPVDALYSPSHFWLSRQEGGQWRVGFTKFATRMLGEMVDHNFDAVPGSPVLPGQVLGWIEGFKAISDLFCTGTGTFGGGNPALREKVTLVNKEPHTNGWLYEFTGEPDATCVDVHGYIAHLDKTIDKILEKQQAVEE